MGLFGERAAVRGAESLSAVELEFYSKTKLISEHDFYHPGSVPPRFSDTFLASRYKTYQLSDDFIFYRGGSSEQGFGQFLSFDKPSSELLVRIDKAVRPLWSNGGRSIVDTGYALKIPKDTIVHVGDVSSQSGIFLGGTRQIFVDRPWLLPGAKVIDSYALKEELLWNQIAMKK